MRQTRTAPGTPVNLAPLRMWLMLALMLLASGWSIAQPKKKEAKKFELYCRGGLGYGFTQAGQTSADQSNLSGYNGYANYTYDYNGAVSDINLKVKPVSFSSGVTLPLAIGCMFSKYVGFDLSAIFRISNPQYKFDSTGIYADETTTSTFKTHGRGLLLLNPSIVLQTGTEPWSGYARLGIVLPLLNTVYQELDKSTNNFITGSTTSAAYEQSCTTSFSVGYSASLGISYRTSGRLSFYAEAGITSLSLYLKQGTLTKYEINGKDLLSTVPANDKVINYTGSASFPPSPNTFNQFAGSSMVQTYSLPYSNIGISLGVRVHLL